MRPYNKSDYDYLYSSLKSEGFSKEQMTFEADMTFLTDSGFFSFRIENGFPRLVHFYIDKDMRSLATASSMLKVFIDIMRRNNYLFFIAEAPKELPYMKRIIKYIKGKEYLKVDGDTFFYVPVCGRFK